MLSLILPLIFHGINSKHDINKSTNSSLFLLFIKCPKSYISIEKKIQNPKKKESSPQFLLKTRGSFFRFRSGLFSFSCFSFLYHASASSCCWGAHHRHNTATITTSIHHGPWTTTTASWAW